MYKNTDKTQVFFETRKDQPDFFFILAFPLDRDATCKLAATEDSLVLHKIMFRGYPIISIVSPTEWLERL